MGAGRKTETFTAPPNQGRATYTTSLRNLIKKHLGGVIFGCKDITIKECLSKQLFGLPAAHFLYVKKISPGLPLFLFNYTDRKLHGIYEAAGYGQMNINPCGWTTDGSNTTPFPAQVKFRARLHCVPLPEHQFREIIADNYYNEIHFWFELDHAQTSKLISKLASGAVAPSTPAPQRYNLAPVAVCPSPSVPQISKLASVKVGPRTSAPQIPKLASVEVAPRTSAPQISKVASLEVASRTSVPPKSNLESVEVAPRTSEPQKTLNWRSCFAAPPSHDTIEEPEWLELLTSEAQDLSNSCQNLDVPVPFGRYGPFKSQLDVKDVEQMGQEHVYKKLKDLAIHDNLNNECQGVALSGDVEDSVAGSSHPSFDQRSRDSPCALSAQKSGEIPLSLFEHQALIAKLIEEVGELKAFKTEQSQKISYLEYKLEQAETEIQRLKVWFED